MKSASMWAGVTVMVPALSRRVLLLSRTTHPAVLIITNGCHGYGELKSGCYQRVLDATNFVTRLRSRRWRGRGSVHTTKASIALQDLESFVVTRACREISLRPFRKV